MTMSKYQDYADKPREFLALTGYTRTEFDTLLPYFTDQFYKYMKQYRLDGKPRGKRRYGDYQNSPLPTPADKLFFILSYLKTNNLQEVQGAMFGISQPKANQWIHILQVVLQQTLTSLNEMPARSMEAVVFDEENSLYFHDGTERSIPRPTDAAKQKEFYSGKKKGTPSKTTS
jgi:hypothetical protein